ncbi:MAG: Mrp/NBP35 family ATP-binding protein [Myxococcales bacterium]|nr:Mrp/NBP35 family ATP-binding protein [Myxococcales bacterium]
MTTPTLESVQQALGAVIDPTFERSLADLDALSNVELDGTKLKTQVRIASPAEQVRKQIRERLNAAVQPLGVTHVEIAWKVQVPKREASAVDPIPDVRNVILIISGKGGVGKSSVAANLAMSLRRAGTRVGLLDADIYGPSVPTMLGISGHPSSKDGKRIIPMQRFGLKMMSIGFLLEDDKQAVVWRGPMLHGALQQFIADVDWGELDYLLIDLPPGTGDVALTLAQKVKLTGAVVVTTPQEVALQDVYKSVSMCHKLNIPVLGVVENMSYYTDSAGVRQELFGAGGGAKIAEYAKAPLLGQVPLDPKVREWGDAGMPVVQAEPEAPAAQAFALVADALTNHIAAEHFERGAGQQTPTGDKPKKMRILR